MRKNLIRFGLLLLVWIPFVAQAQLPLYDLPNSVQYPVTTSSNIVLTNTGRMVMSNPLTDRVVILNPRDGNINAEVIVGANPNGIALTPDGQRALAVSSGSGLLGIIDLNSNLLAQTIAVGGELFHIVTRNDRAYISRYDASDVIVIDLEEGRVSRRISTPPNPAGLALWGDFLYVTHYWSGELSLIYLPANKVVQTIQPHPKGSHSQAIVIDPVAGRAYLPQTISDDTTPNDAQRMTPVVQVIDLETFLPVEQIDLTTFDVPIALPLSATQPSNRARLYFANVASNNATVINVNNKSLVSQIEVGAAPQGILFSRNFAELYTYDGLDGAISQMNTAFFGLDDVIPAIETPIPATLQIGARLFYTATDTRLSDNSMTSCAACHRFGDSDGRTWFDAPTPALKGRTIPTDDALNDHIRTMQGGLGLEPQSLDMLALRHYLARELGMVEE